ncbi:galactokinase [Puccinia graminis f. sp. tritici CRL 75-36-700-3]|uniref:Galactokinase n=1 Tax=Puccinia graminis f. sp. tritici (strain CRL 75-36-700-3 / race SCCL) TaxID=418459 RepID=E3KBS9_PUCGT|nr:galactokinase [Puccinia graminis f. sp. tritici CRL 75-36-700-3]EFP81724.1 galactokinase [Puccinia graminis f. sp. tritici CRL 75-36-700-3]
MAVDGELVLFPDSLEQVYTQASVNKQSKRWSQLTETFKKSYAHPPQFVARAPGRVNIIGEHIDYCGFSVLPSAIEPDLLIATSVEYADEASSDFVSSDRTIQVQAINVNRSYPEVSFDYQLSGKIPIDNGGWSDYLKSAFNTTLDHLRSSSSHGGKVRQPTSIKFLIDGTVPAGSGLSSSAAISTASVLAVLYIHQSANQHIPKTLAASLAIASEQACGVSIGGMDQTASVFGQPAKLLHIEFTPTIKVVPLELPGLPSTTFIIANSLVTSNKLDSAKEQYNLRVVECRIANRILSDKLLKGKQPYPKDLKELVELYSPKQSIPHAIQLVLDNLSDAQLLGGDEGLTQDAVLENLGINQTQFEAEILNGMVVEPRGGIFKPYNRARHVLTEALRVYRFRELLEKTVDSGNREEVILSIGQLMNESQKSCREDYECSCEALDELISIAQTNGSLGSRLTGAGWGGSSVHLVRDPDISKIIEALKSKYYCIKFPNLSTQELADACFATKPEGGACLFTNLKQAEDPEYDFEADMALLKQEILASHHPSALKGLMKKLRQVRSNTRLVPIAK